MAPPLRLQQHPVACSGQRVSENNYEIDGVSVNSLGWGGAAVVSSTPGVGTVFTLYLPIAQPQMMAAQ